MVVFGVGGLAFSIPLWCIRLLSGASYADLGLLAAVGFPFIQAIIILVGWLIRREGKATAHKELLKKAMRLLPSDRENP